MRSLDKLLLAQLLPRLLSSACPSTVPRSGSAGERINCFITTIREGDEPNLVLLRMADDRVEGLQFANGSYSIDVTIPLTDLNPHKVHLTHFYGLDEVRYKGIRAVARGLWTGWPYAQLHLRRLWDAVAQRLFNRRTLAARRRLDVLREIVEATTNGATAVDAMDLMSGRYGYRWASHPEWEAHHQQLERQLELLGESGDLRRYEYKFQPTGQALRTLEESEEADRKHVANYRVQVLLALLTLVSAIMAAAQAGLLKLPVVLDLTANQAPAPTKPAQTPQAPKVPLAVHTPPVLPASSPAGTK